MSYFQEAVEGKPPISLETMLKELGEYAPMYVGACSLRLVRAYLDGFVIGRMGYAENDWRNWREFTEWLIRKFRSSGSYGWTYALNKKYPDEKEAIQQLYPLYQEFLNKQKKANPNSD